MPQVAGRQSRRGDDREDHLSVEYCPNSTDTLDSIQLSWPTLTHELNHSNMMSGKTHRDCTAWTFLNLYLLFFLFTGVYNLHWSDLWQIRGEGCQCWKLCGLFGLQRLRRGTTNRCLCMGYGFELDGGFDIERRRAANDFAFAPDQGFRHDGGGCELATLTPDHGLPKSIVHCSFDCPESNLQFQA